MKPRHQATKAAIELIKCFEGFRRRAAALPDGSWTIGYGHTRTARPGAEISEADADALLIYDVSAVVKAINEWVFSPLTENQFDALVAFVFNIGLPNFRRSSVLRRLNEGSHLQAACAMEMWRTADFEGERIVIDALVRRRSAEMALFLTPQQGFVPVPSLIVMPRVDDDVARRAPLRTTEVEAPLEGFLTEVYRTGEPDDLSASRAAAESVTARLNAILQDHGADYAPPPAPPLAEEAGVEADLASDAVFEAPAVAALEPQAEPAPEPLPESIFEPAVEGSPMAFSARPPRTATGRFRKKNRTPEPVLALVGVVGLMVFAAGLFWAFNAKAAERLPLPVDPVTTGWVLGLAGIALAAGSVYVLLNRGSRGE
ncbi:MAG: lysozyme family protein [Caulobacteraceae bacterium]|nr:lysozyme family protein [Caulobacteraceae bacterium]